MDMSEEMESRVNNMCNLGEGIYEQGIERGIEQGIKQGIEQGIERGRKQERMQMILSLLSKFSAEEIVNLGIQVSAEELREAKELRKEKE